MGPSCSSCSQRNRVGPIFARLFARGKAAGIGAEGDIHFYDVGKGIEIGSIASARLRVRTLEFSLDGKTLFSAGANSYTIRPGYGGVNAQLRMWDVAQKRLLRDFIPDKAVLGWCTVALSKDGRKLVCMQENDLVIWDVATGKLSRKIASYWPPTGLAETPNATEYFMRDARPRRGDLAGRDDDRLLSPMPLHNAVTLGCGKRDVKNSRFPIRTPPLVRDSPARPMDPKL